MKSLEKTYHYQDTLENVWEAFVNPEEIEKWDAGPVNMSDEEGEEFSLWGGDIHGKNIEVEKYELLKQEWFGGEWEQPSIVEFTFSENEDGKIEVHLKQTNIPDESFVEIDAGWDDYYLGAISKYFDSKKIGH
ncbi:SRPBCC domain-containing protein [Candidatus Dojkabacteria bacterium]|uniref:SRPBCC domain-containing protein n=1 Tax=Candidatus Dojkabacteria bacterium TaxID=2099670 RepID=A0A955LB71_9BACT|nr:SRPBCC domain-containing protein [Candidatus Dojkabacteria bacterium]